MKKTLLVFMVVCYVIHANASVNLKADIAQKDTAKINKQVRALKTKLASLTAQLAVVQKRIPEDSVKMQQYLEKSHDAQVKSKKSAKNAVGGDVGDARKAEKLAKKAASLTDDANDATRQLEKDRKKEKNLTSDIEETQKKLDKLIAPQ